MRITEVTWRHRNDFHFKAQCEHCSHIAKYADGYADHFYCTQVVPNRHCPECNLNSYGNSPAVMEADGRGTN